MDFFRPVLDSMSTALSNRLFDDCTKIRTHILALFQNAVDEHGLKYLASLAQLDRELFLAEAKLLYILYIQYIYASDIYTATETLGSVAETMVSSKYNIHTASCMQCYEWYECVTTFYQLCTC